MGRRKLGTALVVVAVGLGAWACDGGSMMIDVGTLLVDGGWVMRADAHAASDGQVGADGDVEPDDGSRPMPPVAVDVPCEPRTYRTERDGVVSETTFWYATLEDATISPLDAPPRVVQCDRESFAPTETPACPDGVTCSGEYPTAPSLRCNTFTGGDIEEGRFRVFCGNRSRTVTADGTETLSGQRWTSVRVTLDP